MRSYRWPLLLLASAVAHGAVLMIHFPPFDLQPPTRSTLTVNLLGIDADDSVIDSSPDSPDDSPIDNPVDSQTDSLAAAQANEAVSQRHPAAKPLVESEAHDPVPPTPASTPIALSQRVPESVIQSDRREPDDEVAENQVAENQVAENQVAENQVAENEAADNDVADQKQPDKQQLRPEQSKPEKSKLEQPNLKVEVADTEADELNEEDFAPVAMSAELPTSTLSSQTIESTPSIDMKPSTLAVSTVDVEEEAAKGETVASVEQAVSTSPNVSEAAAPTASQSVESVSNKSATRESALRQQIRARFDHDLVYPALARKRGWEGNVDVMLRVNPGGRIQVLSVLQSSGFGLLDRYTRKTLEHIRLDEQTLDHLDGGYHDLRIEVQYLLLASRG